MRRDNRRCAKAHRNEAVLCGEVGDKLQSCELKWFMASAKGDKFTPLCSTNHRSRMVTLLAAGQPVATCHTHADHVDLQSVKHIGRKIHLGFGACNRTKKWIPYSVPCVLLVAKTHTKAE